MVPVSLLLVLTSMVNQLGYGGVGYIWSICEGSHEEEWRHSVAPIPAEKLAEITQVVEDDLELVSQDSNAPASSGEVKPDTQTNAEDDAAYFEKEVEKLRDQILILFNFLAEWILLKMTFVCVGWGNFPEGCKWKCWSRACNLRSELSAVCDIF